MKHFKPVSTKANLEFILNFIEQLLRNIIYHRNPFQHYHSTMKDFKEHFDVFIMDREFSESLSSFPIKYEIQSLAAHKVTVYSSGGNHYHTFVKCTIEDMLSEFNLQPTTTTIVENKNCKFQCKCTAHFSDIKNIAGTFNPTIIKFYGIPEHGKRKLDHFSSICKGNYQRGDYFWWILNWSKIDGGIPLVKLFCTCTTNSYHLRLRRKGIAREKGIITAQNF